MGMTRYLFFLDVAFYGFDWRDGLQFADEREDSVSQYICQNIL
jgi:hypothetical protein